MLTALVASWTLSGVTQNLHLCSSFGANSKALATTPTGLEVHFRAWLICLVQEPPWCCKCYHWFGFESFAVEGKTGADLCF
jgi:hypothetical protein